MARTAHGAYTTRRPLAYTSGAGLRALVDDSAGLYTSIGSPTWMRIGASTRTPCAYLCSVHAGFIVGQNILHDGGGVNATL